MIFPNYSCFSLLAPLDIRIYMFSYLRNTDVLCIFTKYSELILADLEILTYKFLRTTYQDVRRFRGKTYPKGHVPERYFGCYGSDMSL